MKCQPDVELQTQFWNGKEMKWNGKDADLSQSVTCSKFNFGLLSPSVCLVNSCSAIFSLCVITHQILFSSITLTTQKFQMRLYSI